MANWIGWVPRESKDGTLKIMPGSDLGILEASILQILNTIPGERVHLPKFGSNLKLLVFEPVDEFVAIQIKDEIKEAINIWEDRLHIVEVDVILSGENDSFTEQNRGVAIVRYVTLQGIKDVQEFKIGL